MSSESTPAQPDYSALLDADRRNRTNVKCNHCGSLILKSSNACFDDSEFNLPLAKQKTRAEDKEKDFTCEPLRHFWMVQDMYTFENIGFSNTVNNRKYLICADCEIGPIGYHDLETKKCYVALDRVKHE